MCPQESSAMWLIIGFAAQALFTGRFVVQWIYSEKHGKSLIPLAFWYFSIAGGVSLLIYAIHRQDPVFIAGQAGGLIVYVRNLFLIRKDRRRTAAANTPLAE
jgi:lipid-A-disaccharide synthase-like uncharacterized protein